MDRYIYKICARPQWQQAEQAGVFTGAEIDIKDGYIHLSSQSQIAETLALHFTNQPDLLLIEVDSALWRLNGSLRGVASFSASLCQPAPDCGPYGLAFGAGRRWHTYPAGI